MFFPYSSTFFPNGITHESRVMSKQQSPIVVATYSLCWSFDNARWLMYPFTRAFTLLLPAASALALYTLVSLLSGMYFINPCPMVAIHRLPRESDLMSNMLSRFSPASSTLLYIKVLGSIYPSPCTYAPAHILPCLSSARARMVLGMLVMCVIRL